MITDRKQCITTISNIAIIRKIKLLPYVSFKNKRTMIIITYVYNDHVKMSLDKINQNVKIDIYMYSNKFFCEWMIILPIFEDFIIQHC